MKTDHRPLSHSLKSKLPPVRQPPGPLTLILRRYHVTFSHARDGVTIDMVRHGDRYGMQLVLERLHCEALKQFLEGAGDTSHAA